jgi:uncharacterized protein
VSEPIFRLLPDTEGPEGPFWTGGAEGVLRVQRCQSCRYWIHPASIACPNCLSRELAFEETSGKGTLFSFAVSHQPAGEGVPLPYIIGLIELPEQEGLRLTSNLVNCEPADAVVDMPVRVVFEQHEDVFIPVFEPDRG